MAPTVYCPKVVILVSGYDHCFADLLYRHSAGELACDVVMIISNHAKARLLADFYGSSFHLLTNPQDKRESEQEMLELIGHDVDLIVLARYMQILSSEFVGQYLLRMINVHHSFLPAFVGAKPYHQALERGVKLIGATSHFVTATLDEGPIIEQDVTRVSHRDTVEDIMRKGRDLEKVALARASVGIWKIAFWCTRTRRWCSARIRFNCGQALPFAFAPKWPSRGCYGTRCDSYRAGFQPGKSRAPPDHCSVTAVFQFSDG